MYVRLLCPTNLDETTTYFDDETSFRWNLSRGDTEHNSGDSTERGPHPSVGNSPYKIHKKTNPEMTPF